MRGELGLLLGRLLVREIEQESDPSRRTRLLDEAGRVLAASEAAPRAAIEALSARCARLAGNDDEANRYLHGARADDPADLDVAVALIENARREGRYEAGLEAARAAADALPVLTEAKLELDRLLQDAPAELWAAVAERALAENHLEFQKEAADRAQSLVPWDAYALRALILEEIAEGTERRDEPITELVSALVGAGEQRVFAGQLDAAVGDFERVLKLQPGHGEACVRLADCLVTLTSGQPLASARPQLERALELLNTGREVFPQYTWGYLTEAEAHEQLAAAASADRKLHAWKALLAACRAVVNDPRSSSRWGDLTTAGSTLSLYSFPVAAARHAVELDPNDYRARALLVRSLANAGVTDEALDLLGRDDDPWSRAVRAHLSARLGKTAEALRLLRDTELDPSWSWAHSTYAAVLLQAGNYDEAMTEAQLARSAWDHRLDEAEGLWTVAWAAVMQSDYRVAEKCANDLEKWVGEGDGHLLLGMIRLLQGDERGIQELIEYVGLMRTKLDVLALEPLFLAFIRALASYRGIELPPLDGVDKALARQREELEELADPLVELGNAVAPESDEDVVALATAMCTALMNIVEQDPVGARHATEGALAKHPDDRELTLLMAAVAAQESAVAASASADGDSSPEPLAPPPPALPERPLEMVMPPSWFAGYSDPLNEHPFFLRYLPELRANAEIPGSNVRIDEDLEPDGYAIFIDGEKIDEGRISRDYFYAKPEALELLGGELSSVAENDEATGFMRIPRSAVSDSDRLVPLLSIVAEEYVARRIVELASEHADRFAAVVR